MRGHWIFAANYVRQDDLGGETVVSDLIILGERWSNFKDVAKNSDQQYEICAPFHLRSNRTDQDAAGEDWNTIHKGNIPLLYLDGHVKHGRPTHQGRAGARPERVAVYG